MKLSDSFLSIYFEIKIVIIAQIKEQTIIFSPCAASFDNFRNFEDRGYYFNELIKEQLNGKYKVIL